MRRRDATNLNIENKELKQKNEELAKRNLYLAKKNVLFAKRMTVAKKLLKESSRYAEWVAAFMPNQDAMVTYNTIKEFLDE